MRGGFSFGGMELKFGATLSTMIDSIKLETIFNITSAGAEIVSQILVNLASANEVIAALTQNVSVQKQQRQSSLTQSEATTATVAGPAAGATPATGTPSALQPTVPAPLPTAVPSPQSARYQSPVSTAAPIIENPIVQTTPDQPSIAMATAGSNPTATIYTPPPASSSQAAMTTQATPTPSTTMNAPSSATITSQPQSAPISNAVLIGPERSLSDLTPVDVNLQGINDAGGFSGLVISNSKGFTAALHKLTQDAIISAVVSNASGLKIRQQLAIKIDIQNVKSARETSRRAAISQIAGGMFK